MRVNVFHRRFPRGLNITHPCNGGGTLLTPKNPLFIEIRKSEGLSSTLSAAIFDDCKVLAFGFRDIVFEHYYREVKEVAHELARFSFNDRSYCFFGMMTPPVLFCLNL
jgi:hypothetical protein